MTIFKSVLKTASLMLLFTVFSCSQEEIVPRRNLNGESSAAILKTELVSKTDKILRFRTDVYLVDEDGNFYNGLRFVQLSTPKYSNVVFTPESINNARLAAKGPYSSALLIDQSGSINSSDPNDMRILASRIFASALGPNDEVALAAFTSSYSGGLRILNNFTQDSTLLLPNLEELALRASGGTPLYRSTSEMIDYVVANANQSNKAVIAFTDGEDTNGGISLQALTEKARNANVQIYTVGLSEDVDENVLAYMAGESDGAFMWAEDADQLITMFGTLGDLLSGSAEYYSIVWEAERQSGSWSTFSSMSARFIVSMPDRDVIIPFRVIL